MTPFGSQALVPIPSATTALYTLAIRNPDGSAVTGGTYTFPLSPTNVSKKFTGMGNYYDVAGPVGNLGVQRQIDQYGNSPVTYVLEGTTGWQRHAIDGGQLTGLQSILAIQKLLNYFAQLNAGQQVNGAENLYTLEFHDYFTNDFWGVVPLGEQEISLDAARPLLFKYLFRLVGYQNLANSPAATAPDEVLQTFQTLPAQAQANNAAAILAATQAYASLTPGAAAYQDLYGAS
jgi:hypothetical protein